MLPRFDMLPRFAPGSSLFIEPEGISSGDQYDKQSAVQVCQPGGSLAEYSREYPADTVHSRMREHMKYLSCCFEGSHKALKAIRKSTPKTYPEAAAMLFSLPLAENAAYDPEVFAK